MLRLKTLKRFFSVSISILIICFIFFYYYIRVSNSKNQKELLRYADGIVNSNVVDINSNEDVQTVNEKEIFSKNEENNNIIGKILIKKIGVNAPIMDGTGQEVLKVAVGHFQRTSYWNGNVALASHNRGSYAHYFERLNELEKGDEIIYQTKLGTRLYTVVHIEQIDECNWEPLASTDKNTLTLITCIKNKPECRLCVKAVQNI